MGHAPIKANLSQTQPLPSPPGPHSLPLALAPGPRSQARRTSAGDVLRSAQGHLQSRNWAGAVVPANRGRRFSRIEGSWTIPHIDERDDAKGLVSIWVGLGGSHPASSSMPQIGSEHGWEGTRWVNRLWCQWWLGGGRVTGFMSQWLTNVELRPGDLVACSLEVMDDPASGPDRKVVFQWHHNGTVYDHEWINQVPVKADTANWIVERPTEVYQPPCDMGRTFLPGVKLGRHHPLPGLLDAHGHAIRTGQEVAVLRGCRAALGPVGDAAIRRPADGRLVSLRSIVPRQGRVFVELEPAVQVNPRNDELRIARHLP